MNAQENIRIIALNHDKDRINVIIAATDSTELRFLITNLADAKANLTEKSLFKIRSSVKPDITPPVIISTVPRNGSSVNELTPVIEVNFSEVIPISLFKAKLVETESKNPIPFKIIKSNSRRYLIQPEKPLSNYKTCQLTIEEKTSDISGNRISEPYIISFLPIIRNP